MGAYLDGGTGRWGAALWEEEEVSEESGAEANEVCW